MAGGAASGARPKKQNHANIPCPIEHCARFTYGKLPDHLSKRHGLVGAERDAVNEQQRKRFFNGELCQVRFLKEEAIRDLWGADYDEPRIRAKILDTCAMVKIRVIPLAATARARPLTEQDANLLTSYNARTDAARRRPAPAPAPAARAPPAKRLRQEEWPDCSSDENRSSPRSLPPTPPPSADASPAPPAPSPSPDILDGRIDECYKFVLADMKRCMGSARTLPARERKQARTHRRYARRLIAFLQRQHSPLAYDLDVLLCSEPLVLDFLERVRARCKPKAARNYVLAALKLLESRLRSLRAEDGGGGASGHKTEAMARLYDVLFRRLPSSSPEYRVTTFDPS